MGYLRVCENISSKLRYWDVYIPHNGWATFGCARIFHLNYCTGMLVFLIMDGLPAGVREYYICTVCTEMLWLLIMDGLPTGKREHFIYTVPIRHVIGVSRVVWFILGIREHDTDTEHHDLRKTRHRHKHRFLHTASVLYFDCVLVLVSEIGRAHV